ncbi:DUF896 domain-containing protein [Paenibacillus sp. IB182496]|uniref:UPF0291 protein IDH44_22495 n=1 Tax=Paenibacillus sabuli TaxID=2772509 RepID=A0A927BYK2_9BACL|nr:DUF896 domain-containing protein [Paenibacillus sabuli]MBD2847975.1 DUF896 domain-containing protein [Paenibacillus sabuli]
MDKLVERINELARKHKTVGLTVEETAERDQLRKQYLEVFKRNFRNQLEAIEWTDEEPDKGSKQ